MNEAEYSQLCAFVQKQSGIVLGQNKAYLVESRLAPISAQFGYGSIGDLARALPLADPKVGAAVVDAMTTNESFFFRDNTPFTQFEKVILPKLTEARRSAGKIRIWCAAASTGQEPYSLAMILMENRPKWAGMQIEIIGTDISETALNRARDGRYTQFEVQRGLPVQLLVKYFMQEGTNWVVAPEIKGMVRFFEHNLLSPPTMVGTVDVVFCRNVLIYFDVETKSQVLTSISRMMRPDGYLLLGAAETMMGISDAFVRAEGERGLYQPSTSEQRRSA
jgi:chemotaxis protein methyltransferase CheR